MGHRTRRGIHHHKSRRSGAVASCEAVTVSDPASTSTTRAEPPNCALVLICWDAVSAVPNGCSVGGRSRVCGGPWVLFAGWPASLATTTFPCRSCGRRSEGTPARHRSRGRTVMGAAWLRLARAACHSGQWRGDTGSALRIRVGRWLMDPRRVMGIVLAGWCGQAPGATDGGPGQGRRSVRRPLPADGLCPV